MTISGMTISVINISTTVRPRGSVQPTHHVSDDQSVMTISVMTVCAVMADRVQRAEEDDGEEDRRDRAPHDADP